MPTPPWVLYAEQLSPLGYGHPLWYPEQEVHVGDVGWLEDESFRAFNQEGKIHSATLDKIMQPHICSQSIQSTDVKAKLTVGGNDIGPVSLGAGFQFKATSDTGAFVVLKPPGKSEDIQSKGHIVKYMRKNFDSWYQFANSDDKLGLGLGLKEQDIVFVCGTIKTTEWAIGAFQGDLKDKTGYVTCNFGSSASVGLSVKVSNYSPPVNHHRHGSQSRVLENPAARLTGPLGDPSASGSSKGSDRPNQCIFIHYYKMKRRIRWQPMRAAAGYDQLPPAARDPESAPLLDAGSATDHILEPTQATAINSRYDPVDYLLDYILLHSAAEIAIASDRNVTAIFTNCDIPADIAAALQRLAPQIEIDEHGVGVVSVEKSIHSWKRSHIESTQLSRNLFAIVYPKISYIHESRRILAQTLEDLGLAAGQAPLHAVAAPCLVLAADALGHTIRKLLKAKVNNQMLLDVSGRIAHLVKLILDATYALEAQMNHVPVAGHRQDPLTERMNKPDVSSTMDRFFFNVRTVLDEANGLYEGPSSLKFIYAKHDAEILSKTQAQVEEASRCFEFECQVKILSEVESLKEAMSHEADDRVLDSLTEGLASTGFNMNIDINSNEYLHGTRSAVLASLESWAAGDAPEICRKGVCLLTGCAGSGKSTIAAELARRLRDPEPGNLGASVVFIRQPEGQDTSRAFILSLARQLALSQRSLRSSIVSAARTLADPSLASPEDLLNHLIVRPLSDLPPREHPIVLVIDSLDEYPPEHLSRLFNLLVAAVRQFPGTLRIFIASRPDIALEGDVTGLLNDPVHRLSLDDEACRKSVESDIQSFFRSSFSKTPTGQQLLGERPRAVQELAARAEGLFFYAKTAMDYLDHVPEKLIARLDILLSSSSTTRQNVLDPMNELYLDILQRAWPRAHLDTHPEVGTHLQEVLGSLAVMREPLSPIAVDALSMIHTEDALAILRRLRAVVLCDPKEPSATLRPLHSTFVEYILGAGQRTDPLYLVNPLVYQSRFAEGCLRTLNHLLPKSIRSLLQPLNTDDTLRIEPLDTMDRVRKYMPPHLQYACLHWVHHLGQCSSSDKKGTLEMEHLEVFVTRRLRLWLVALEYMGSLERAESLLISAREWCEREGYSAMGTVLEERRMGVTMIIAKITGKLSVAPGDDYLSKSSQPEIPDTETTADAPSLPPPYAQSPPPYVHTDGAMATSVIANSTPSEPGTPRDPTPSMHSTQQVVTAPAPHVPVDEKTSSDGPIEMVTESGRPALSSYPTHPSSSHGQPVRAAELGIWTTNILDLLRMHDGAMAFDVESLHDTHEESYMNFNPPFRVHGGATAGESSQRRDVFYYQIPQEVYMQGILKPSDTSIRLVSYGERGVSLSNAIRGDFEDEFSMQAFPDMKHQKQSIRFKIDGQTQWYARQVNVLRVKKGVPSQPSKADIAQVCAREIKRCLEQDPELAEKYPFDSLVLLSVERVSEGSLQPHLAMKVLA